jgi:transcription initiation factor TFIIH subunit 2
MYADIFGNRLLRDTTPLQRGIIRHIIVILDRSFAMSEKDLRPTRNLLTLRYTSAFVTEFFEQNPISQLGIIGMRDGLANRISDLSGNPVDHLRAIAKLRVVDPQGNPSLQNALEMARAALFHAPSHGTREILIISGALLSSDPGDIHTTIANLIQDRIRVSVIGLAAQVAILEEICTRTHGDYNIALHEQHFRDLYMAFTTPPVTRTKKQAQSSLLMMGFPSKTVGKTLTLCACHSKLTRGGYLCSRCRSKVCALPAECPACGLTLILSTHLARSYHHLFPLRNWVEVPWKEAVRSKSSCCFSCRAPFPLVPRSHGGRGNEHGMTEKDKAKVERLLKGLSESGRYKCEVCGNHFCIDCDVFAHEVVHNCPGCQSDARGADGQMDEDNGVVEQAEKTGEVDLYGVSPQAMDTT